MTIPSSVTKIGSYAFSGCSGLEKVIVPDLAAWCRISSDYASNPLDYAHHLYSDENTEITDLIIPDGVTSIGNYAFYDCNGLTSLTILDNITVIGSAAFGGVPQTLLQAKRGTKTLLSFWRAGYEPYEKGTTNTLVRPALKAVSSATQSTIKIKAEPVYKEYKYYVYNEDKLKEIEDGDCY